MATRLEKSVQAMALEYPALRFRLQESSDNFPVGVWIGSIQPIQSEHNLLKLLDDLEHDRQVYVMRGGQLLHWSRCMAEHCIHDWTERLIDPFTEFSIEIRHNGGREHPKCFISNPYIPQEKQRHFWADGSICPFMASEDIWVWNKNTVADFMPHVIVWLARWMVWDQTGHWPGIEHQMSPQYHLANIRPGQQCWCRSGRKYYKCHMNLDRMAAGIQPHLRAV